MSEYAEELTSKLPDGLDCVFFTSSGSQTNEMAVQFSRLYTGNYPVVNLRGGYHGHIGTKHLSHIPSWNENLPKTQGVEAACFVDMYRGNWANNEAEAAQ